MPETATRLLPVSKGALRQFRLGMLERQKVGSPGRHLQRRRGQSLEFRELLPYRVGDDVRHIDWRASMRAGGMDSPDRWVVRSFQAEDRVTVAISIDDRPSMRHLLFPDEVSAGFVGDESKLLIASWIAMAIAEVMREGADVVLLHRLFQSGSTSPREVSRQEQVKQVVDEWSEGPSRLAIEELRPKLPPASVWIVVSDWYCEALSLRSLCAAMATARTGYRRILAIDIETWGLELELMRRRHGGRSREGSPNRIVGPRGPRDRVRLKEKDLETVRATIEAHKQGLSSFSGRERTVWEWPSSDDLSAETLFKKRFFEDRELMDLLS